MKINCKTTLLLFLLSFTFYNVEAQLGIKAGYNLSSLQYFSPNDGDNFNEEAISGYQLGLVYHLGIGDKFSILPEASFSTSGGRSEIQDFTFQNVKLNGLINYNLIGNNEGLAIQLTGGVFANYVLTGESDIGLGFMDINFQNNEDIERNNIGYILGAGIKVNSFILSVRGSFGVRNLIDLNLRDSAGEVIDLSIRSREFSVIGIYVF